MSGRVEERAFVSCHALFVNYMVMQHAFPCFVHSNKCLRQITLKVTIPKTRRRILEVRTFNRLPRRSRHTLPRNSRLLAALVALANLSVTLIPVRDT